MYRRRLPYGRMPAVRKTAAACAKRLLQTTLRPHFDATAASAIKRRIAPCAAVGYACLISSIK